MQRRGRFRELAGAIYVMARFWLTVYPLARKELRAWADAADTIPDPTLRALARSTLRDERLSAMGAALVATTVRPHSPQLVRLLVALQLAWDYIDTLAEQPAEDPVANGVQLHRALLDAVDDAPKRGDYYRLHASGEDDGYLAALVTCCRQAGARLPALERVRQAAMDELRAAEVQYAHHAEPRRREAVLRRWATEQANREDAKWFELVAAASSSLGVLALLALAADPGTSDAAVAQVRAAYAPWVDALTALLDSLVDRDADARAGLANWIDHYPADETAARRLTEVAARAVGGVRALPAGGRHVAIVTGMMALHLSHPAARTAGVAPVARALVRAADTPVIALLLLLLRLWRASGARRTAYADGGACVPTPTPTGQLTPVPPSPQ